jgi:hypothetical protein
MNKKQLLHIVREQHRKTATRALVNASIGRYLDAVQTWRSIPQEDTRLEVPRSQPEEHGNTLRVYLSGKCAEFVFNLDELGATDWQDRKIKKLITSAPVPKEDAYDSVSRRPLHITLLACVSAAGDVMIPLFMTSTLVPDSPWSRGGP